MEKRAGEKTLHLHRLNIGNRLTLCFVCIILAMLVGNAILLWQFHRVRTDAERLSGVDQQLIAVLQAHTNLMSFYEKLDALAQSEDTARLAMEVETLHHALLENNRRSLTALNSLPPEAQMDPTLLPTLKAIEDALPAHLEAITVLANSRDWEAVRLRLANQIRPLESRLSTLVENIDREVGEERSRAVLNIGEAQRRVFLIVPITALLTLLFASVLGLAVTRSITQPLGRLIDASKALGRGEFQHRVSVVGKDEFAQVGRVFNDTAGTLRDLYGTLSSREAYLTEAQRLCHTGSFGWNIPNGELVWSDETFRIFEYSQTVKPTLDLVLERTHPEDVALIQQHIDRVALGGTDWDLEHRLLMPNGSVKYVRAVAHAVRDSSDQLVFVGAVVDLTPSKRAEEALRQTQATLAHAARVSALGEMAASIAHEVNQPLAAVIANSQAGLRWLSADPPNLSKVRESLEDVVHDGNDAASAVRRVRGLFKGAAPEKTALDLNDLISEVLQLLREETLRRGVVVETNLEEGLPAVPGDRVQIQHLILNLVTNGIESMDTVTDRPKKLSVLSRRDGPGAVQVDVRDHGIGIREPDRVFEAFFTTKESGLGMGLAICRSIAEAHDGRLWVASSDASGTTFSFALPIRPL
jgi:signal transduction histidine kinase/HAMP domain-containing protein